MFEESRIEEVREDSQCYDPLPASNRLGEPKTRDRRSLSAATSIADFVTRNRLLDRSKDRLPGRQRAVTRGRPVISCDQNATMMFGVKEHRSRTTRTTLVLSFLPTLSRTLMR